ncbi:hypothetical protein TSAR_003711 [Trichomalopsis sarcophagae]|uniref:SET domain-containing protein n=1 Tax=Trichomalopsis sarcophagae TaxID=543379 RepID=A0A232EWQ2_9HYME|nr:hypothetical protein TSAR_003711 [Trichomalopsis sarcophagae]
MSDEPQPTTRDGLEWNDEDYEAIVRTIADNDLDPLDIAALSLDEVNAFSSKEYKRHDKDRRRFWESLKHFIKIHHIEILKDFQRLKRGENIIAPKRRVLIDQLVQAIDSCTQGRDEIQQFIENSEFELSPALQEVIYDSLKENMNFKTMKNLLISQRLQIIQGLGLMSEMRFAGVKTKANELTPPKVNETSMNKSSQVISSKVDSEIIRSKILNGSENGLEKMPVRGKGMGIRTTKNFAINEYIVEYTGELISKAVGHERMSKYAKDESFGNFLLSFRLMDKKWFIDATKDDGRLGRWVNHSSKNSNAKVKVMVIDTKPRVFLMASREISTGEEILYDYGERDPETIKNNPWLLE